MNKIKNLANENLLNFFQKEREDEIFELSFQEIKQLNNWSPSNLILILKKMRKSNTLNEEKKEKLEKIEAFLKKDFDVDTSIIEMRP